MPAEYAAPLALAALVVALLGLLLALVLHVRVSRLGRTRSSSRTGDDDVSRLLGEQIVRLDALSAELARHADQLSRLEAHAERAVQRVGVVRFNPFDDTGSNQSFALALLDRQDNGVVVSSLHSRQVTRVYLKSISGGRSETTLSGEETEALRRAGARTPPPA